MLSYLMDIEPHSCWLRATPTESIQALGFYCTEAGTFYCRKNFNTIRSKKTSYLLLFTFEGEGIVEQDEKVFKATPNTIVLLDCNKPHSYCTSSMKKWNFHWAHVNGSSVDGFFSLLQSPDSPLYHVHKGVIDMQDSWAILIEHMKQDTFEDSLEVCMQIHNILQLTTNEKINSESVKNQSTKDLCYAAAKYLREHYNEDITLDLLSQHIALSKSYLIRIFNQYFSTSPYNYLLHYRITKAKELLCTTELTVSEICDMIGFKNTNNFIAQFSRICLQSPLQYRKSFFNTTGNRLV